MSQPVLLATGAALARLLIQIALLVRVLLRPHRDPASRIAWIVVIVAMPVAGILAYLLLGEVSLGRARVQRMRSDMARLPRLEEAPVAAEATLSAEVPEHHRHLFRVGQSISGFDPIGGNGGRLLPSPDATIAAMVADIEAAHDQVHVLFYIWLPDTNGLKVAEALSRAARRGVVCRAMADDLGSRRLIRSPHWGSMGKAGIHLARALPVGNPLVRALKGRIDLRNHRKIVVIDDHITYCGSQNCADPAFLIKSKYAPWVDAMIRFEGPIARQNQHLFATDWTAHTDEDLGALLLRPLAPLQSGFPAQVGSCTPSP